MNVTHVSVKQIANAVAVVSVKMKKTLLIMMVWLVGLVSAHTGKDMYDHYMTGGDWFFGGIFMSLIIVVLILLIIYLIKQIQKK